MIYFMVMKEFMQSAVLAGSMTFSHSIGYENQTYQDVPEDSGHHLQIESEHNNSLELNDLSNGLKIAVTLGTISAVAFAYASARRFTMHSEKDQDIAMWTSLAGIAATGAVILLDTWTSAVSNAF
jgi:hypothetical protein